MDHEPYDWDPAKNEANKRKHGISFEEAREVFKDRYIQIAYDADHSDDEDRFISLGKVPRGIILAVVHTDRFGIIRIISARLASKREVQFYDAERLREQGR